MKPIHVIAYATYRINKLNTKIEATKARYAIAKIEYEAEFLPKLFGWKYEDSVEGGSSWKGRWFSWDNYHLKNFHALRNKAIYHDKIDSIDMTMGDDFDEASFFNWCYDNSIPY